MWNAFTSAFSHVLTVAWLLGAILMIVTIPACMFKIFSALWESDDPEEEQRIGEGRAKA